MQCLRYPLLVALQLLALLPRVAAQSDTAAHAEAQLHRGTLANGLSYAVLPHTSPKGDISLRLLVRAGSLDERDDERGFAHFVEHMAFNGTRHFPPGALLLYFQQLGLAFGADLNARTSFTQTLYMLDLPEGRAGRLDESLLLLRDYADGLQFLPDEVKKESAVILSELRARDNASSRAGTEILKTLYAGTRVPEREPIGVAEQIERATPEQLRAFYQRTYRPDRMTVIVVGPVEPAAIVAKITDVFASMPAAAARDVPPVVPEPPRFDEFKADIVPLPFAKGATVWLMSAGERPPDTADGRREELVRRIAMGILHLRLNARREEDVTRFGSAAAAYEISPFGASVHYTLRTSTTAPNWASGIELLETEVRRARLEGFTQAEVDEAVAARLTTFRSRVSARGAESADRVADNLAGEIYAERSWRAPADELAEATQALQGLTAAEVTATLDEILPADSLRLFLMAAPAEAPKAERALAVYRKSAGRKLRTKAGTSAELAFNYESFGKPGQVQKRERVEDLDLTLVSFANGVRLNVRPSQLEPERFRLRVVFPLNHSNISRSTGGIADLAGMLMLSSNLKRHKQSELQRLMMLRDVRPQFTVNDGTPVLTITGPSDELPFALKFLTAVLSDVDFDLDHYRIALSRYAGSHRSMMLNAHALGLRHGVYAFAGNDARVLPSPPQALARLQPAETENWLIKHVMHGPLEIGVVGDIDPEAAITAATASVATLPRRKAPAKRGSPLATPKKPVRQEATGDLPGSASVSCVLWPIQLPDTPRDNAALAIAVDVLRDRLIRVVREALGLSYSPTARIHRDLVQRDFAYASMTSTFDTARARQFTEGNVRLANRIAEQGVTEHEFARLREPARARAAADLRNNGWWLNQVVCFAQSRPEVLETARRHGTIFDELTLEDVNRAAQVFKSEKVTITLVHPTANAKKQPAAPTK